MVGCGGWSYRAELFGRDSEPSRIADPIDPTNGAARIRAFFVKPNFARKGVGSMIVRRCEREALRHGFRRLELVPTLPGKRFYEQHGFVAVDPITYVLGHARPTTDDRIRSYGKADAHRSMSSGAWLSGSTAQRSKRRYGRGCGVVFDWGSGSERFHSHLADRPEGHIAARLGHGRRKSVGHSSQHSTAQHSTALSELPPRHRWNDAAPSKEF